MFTPTLKCFFVASPPLPPLRTGISCSAAAAGGQSGNKPVSPQPVSYIQRRFIMGLHLIFLDALQSVTNEIVRVSATLLAVFKCAACHPTFSRLTCCKLRAFLWALENGENRLTNVLIFLIVHLRILLLSGSDTSTICCNLLDNLNRFPQGFHRFGIPQLCNFTEVLLHIFTHLKCYFPFAFTVYGFFGVKYIQLFKTNNTKTT